MAQKDSKEATKKTIRPDDVADQFPEGAIRLFTKFLPPTRDGAKARLWIEGDKPSLEYLGKMILAQAEFPSDCLYGISPKGAGGALFDRKAQVGIVVHRQPCMNPKREPVHTSTASTAGRSQRGRRRRKS